MTKKPTNIAASTKSRLLQLARKRGEDFNLLWLHFIHERLLFRLSRSSHADEFVLKGATLFTVWQGAPHRPTKDLDLLGRGAPDASRLRSVFADICRVQVVDDGLVFDPNTITAEPIREEALYDGIRVGLTVHMGAAVTQVQIDIGFGDATVPPPTTITFPTFLDMDAPVIKAYVPETVVAEKLEAMISLGLANSRMKDFFDIDYMGSKFNFDGERLVKAVHATLRQRQTALPDGLPLALTPVFADDESKARQWRAFQTKLGSQDAPRSLGDIVTALRRFLEPVLAAIRTGGSLGEWPPGGPWREKTR